jgi:hypothetical protein
MMRPRMTSPRMKPPMLMTCVMSSNIGSATVAGGSVFPIKAVADEAIGVEVIVNATSIAAGVEVEVMDAGAEVTGVEPATVAADVGTGERVIGVGEAVALGSGVGVEVAVAVTVGRGVRVGVGATASVGSGVFVGNTSMRGGFVGGSPIGVLVGDCAATLT